MRITVRVRFQEITILNRTCHRGANGGRHKCLDCPNCDGAHSLSKPWDPEWDTHTRAPLCSPSWQRKPCEDDRTPCKYHWTTKEEQTTQSDEASLDNWVDQSKCCSSQECILQSSPADVYPTQSSKHLCTDVFGEGLQMPISPVTTTWQTSGISLMMELALQDCPWLEAIVTSVVPEGATSSPCLLE